jgi:hypothetical protein
MKQKRRRDWEEIETVSETCSDSLVSLNRLLVLKPSLTLPVIPTIPSPTSVVTSERGNRVTVLPNIPASHALTHYI